MSYLHASRSARLAMGAYSISIGLWLLPYQSVQAQSPFANDITVPMDDDTVHAMGSAMLANGIAADDAPLLCFELPDYGAITFTDVEIMTTEQLAYRAHAEHPGGAMNADQGVAIYAQSAVFSVPLTANAYNTLIMVDAYEYQLYRIGGHAAERVSVIFCPDL